MGSMYTSTAVVTSLRSAPEHRTQKQSVLLLLVGLHTKEPQGYLLQDKNSSLPPLWGMSLVEGTWPLPEREAGRKKGLGSK